MTFRFACLSVLSVLVMSACAQIDDSVQTEQVVSAVVLEETTGQQFVIELSYSDAVTYEEAVVLVSDIAVTHDGGLSLAEDTLAHRTAVEVGGLLYEDPRYSDLTNHVFQVRVYSETVDLSQLIDTYRWRWVDTDIVEFIKWCPPGHGG